MSNQVTYYHESLRFLPEQGHFRLKEICLSIGSNLRIVLFQYRALIACGPGAGRLTDISDLDGIFLDLLYEDTCCHQDDTFCFRYTNKRPIIPARPLDISPCKLFGIYSLNSKALCSSVLDLCAAKALRATGFLKMVAIYVHSIGRLRCKLLAKSHTFQTQTSCPQQNYSSLLVIFLAKILRAMPPFYLTTPLTVSLSCHCEGDLSTWDLFSSSL